MRFGFAVANPLPVLLPIVINAVLHPLLVASGQVNVTIDDNNQTITYVPTGEWSLGPTCPSCVAKPDPAHALDGTWHDELFIPANDQIQTMTLSFEGPSLLAISSSTALLRLGPLLRFGHLRLLYIGTYVWLSRRQYGHDVLHRRAKCQFFHSGYDLAKWL